MRITIIGGGNMGKAIAHGWQKSSEINAEEITIIDTNPQNQQIISKELPQITAVCGDYTSLDTADLVLIAIKPWAVENLLREHQTKLQNRAMLVSIAAGISLDQLEQWCPSNTPLFRLMPNTALSVRQSMSFVCSRYASLEQQKIVCDLFELLGALEPIDERLFPAATSLASCGIAYAFRYIRAAMEGGIEMGFYPDQAKSIVIQTLRGAIELLEKNETHPEVEVDKVTTAGGITIKGLNAMEQAGFTPAVIKGLKESFLLS